MSNRTWYFLWSFLFILCALLGFIPEPVGFLKALCVFLSLLFFAPGFALLFQAQKNRDKHTLLLIRNLCLISLGLTLLFLVLNLLSAGTSEITGDLLYGFLVVLSAPMVCSQYWVISLFLWGCLLMTSFSFLKKSKQSA